MHVFTRFASWWRARRARHVNRLVDEDPRTLAVTEQRRAARRQSQAADAQSLQAQARQREIEALRAYIHGLGNGHT